MYVFCGIHFGLRRHALNCGVCVGDCWPVTRTSTGVGERCQLVCMIDTKDTFRPGFSSSVHPSRNINILLDAQQNFASCPLVHPISIIKPCPVRLITARRP